MDLTQLSQAPWDNVDTVVYGPDGMIGEFGFGTRYDDPEMIANATFTSTARLAFDVMLRRGWNPTLRPDGQWVVQERDGSIRSRGSYGWPDPFTALVAADAWYRENVETPQL